MTASAVSGWANRRGVARSSERGVVVCRWFWSRRKHKNSPSVAESTVDEDEGNSDTRHVKHCITNIKFWTIYLLGYPGTNVSTSSSFPIRQLSCIRISGQLQSKINLKNVILLDIAYEFVDRRSDSLSPLTTQNNNTHCGHTIQCTESVFGCLTQRQSGQSSRRSRQAFLEICSVEEPQKKMFISRGAPAYENKCTYEEKVFSARRLLQYFQWKGKFFPLQVWTGPWGSGRLRLPDFSWLSALWRW